MTNRVNKLRKLDEAKVRKLIRKSVKEKLLWETYIKTGQEQIALMKEAGVDRYLINESLLGLLTRLIKTIMGTGAGAGAGGALGLGDTGAGDSAVVNNFKTILKERVFASIMSSIGLDPTSAFALVLSNSLESCIEKLADKDFKSMISGGSSCRLVAEKLTSCVMDGATEGLSDKAITQVFDSTLGTEFKNNPFTRNIYLTVRESFSDAVEPAFNNSELSEKMTNEICNLDLQAIMQSINPDIDSVLSGITDSLPDVVKSNIGLGE